MSITSKSNHDRYRIIYIHTYLYINNQDDKTSGIQGDLFVQAITWIKNGIETWYKCSLVL